MYQIKCRDTERLAKSNGSKPKRTGGKPEKDADTRAIEADLSANLHMVVKIEHRGMDEGGVMTISYRTLEDLDLLCDVLSKVPREAMIETGF